MSQSPEKALFTRLETVRLIEIAEAGHYTSVFSAAEIFMVSSAARQSPNTPTVEEHNVLGGLGGAVADVLSEEGFPVRRKRHGIHDAYSLIAAPTHLYRHYKLDGPGIQSTAQDMLAATPR